MGSTMQKQRDEQCEYFIQKEKSLKMHANNKLAVAIENLQELQKELRYAKQDKLTLKFVMFCVFLVMSYCYKLLRPVIYFFVCTFNYSSLI